ncbi:hypothetical protein ACIBG6_01605 [Streptomyces sp. NPDC050842]
MIFFAGHAAAPWLAPLGPHPALARLILRRYDQALARASRPVLAATG